VCRIQTRSGRGTVPFFPAYGQGGEMVAGQAGAIHAGLEVSTSWSFSRG